MKQSCFHGGHSDETLNEKVNILFFLGGEQ